MGLFLKHTGSCLAGMRETLLKKTVFSILISDGIPGAMLLYFA
jgi:hypothetical protein